MSNLLIEESPLLVLPKLATIIGLNEAIMLQQIKYWLKYSKHEREGRKWYYETYEEWQKQFPFWSVPAIKRIALKLEKMNLVITKQFGKLRGDMTKWYTINFEEVERLDSTNDASDQIRTMGGGMGSNSSDHGIKFVPCIRTETSTENTKLTTEVVSNTKGETMSDTSVVAFENLVEELIKIGISESRANDWIKQYGLEYSLEKYNLLKKREKEKIIDNEPAWLAKAIKENWKDILPKTLPKMHETPELTKAKFQEPRYSDPKVAQDALKKIREGIKASRSVA